MATAFTADLASLPVTSILSFSADFGGGTSASIRQLRSRHQAGPRVFELPRNSSARDKSLANQNLEVVLLRFPSRADAEGLEIRNQVELARKSWASYQERLRVLTTESEAEGYVFHPASLDTFRSFVSRYPRMTQDRLVLMENGNLRATWSGDRDTHLGLQFLPDEWIQYVIFTRRPGSDTISRAYGRDTVAGIGRQIEAFDLLDSIPS